MKLNFQSCDSDDLKPQHTYISSCPLSCAKNSSIPLTHAMMSKLRASDRGFQRADAAGCCAARFKPDGGSEMRTYSLQVRKHAL